MDKRYEQYCLADSLFYDSPHIDSSRENFPISGRPLPLGWQRHHIGDWLVSIPPAPRIPQQGWKIHASACLDNAERVLTSVWDCCVPREISFKFVPSRLAVFMRNTKYAPRGGSGKVVTIYPADEAACELILNPATLSAGKRQLIALARAYLAPGRIAILDEATSQLDPSAEALAELAFARRPGTLIVIAHRMSSALRARRVLVLDGVRAQIGDHASLLASSAMYRELVGYWQAASPRPAEPRHQQGPRAHSGLAAQPAGYRARRTRGGYLA